MEIFREVAVAQALSAWRNRLLEANCTKFPVCRESALETVKALGNWPVLGRDTLKDLPDGKLVEITNAGHIPHAEKPDVFDAALVTFLTARLP